MAGKGTSKCCSGFVFILILAGLGCHIAGFVTDFWLVGTSNNSTEVHGIRIGLFHQTIAFQNGTESTTESSLNIFPEQCICLAIAGASALACFIILFKTVHVLVGVSSFVLLTLMIISVFYVFIQVFERKDVVAEQNQNWPTLKLHWSFGLLAGGLLLNIVATVFYLVILLLQDERTPTENAKIFDHAGDLHIDTLPIITVTAVEGNKGDHTNAAFYQNVGSASKNRKDQIDHCTATPIDQNFVDTVSAVSSNHSSDWRTYTGLIRNGNSDHEYADITPPRIKDTRADKRDIALSQVELQDGNHSHYNQTYAESSRL
ncbi:uncharacterized protein LOC127856566 [Dreissena polymorpha]|uniref:Uncharacterized protein n=1 Tax=Dreissena polymorpha TaxID=45954 RepID=A0A9D4CCA0_DREPO|nr:uncharacterized protein LOC127856566 [Dreissena polymorpha]KAH3720823.1 hypothetical protein DPMN_063728 [Dreissena polymorpha]